ncbi:MAG: hypothetical protein P4L53_11850 [Candidatus Obscuribacterales bacterium]|nr:hypothetical protein [Candidatus Obscuribacterales bacterium]
MRQIAFSLLSICFIAGCSQGATGGSSDLHTEVPSGGSILSALRPRFEAKPGGAASALMKVGAAGAPGVNGGSASANGSVLNLGGLGRMLPKTSTELIAPPAEELSAGPVVSTANSGPSATNDWATPSAGAVNPTPVATYGGNYNAGAVPPPPAGALGGGMVPPPPAITLSTQAQTMAFAGGMPAEGGVNPYANPYLNPYGIPFPTQPPMPSGPSARPAGSPFSTGNGGGRQRDDDEEAPAKSKKAANFVPITPSGMEARSSYKQRDDLKVLWKGVLGNCPEIKTICRDDKIAQDLNKIDVALPSGEATKGSISISQRMVDGIFKTNNIADKRIVPSVKKAEMDMVQAYYRYLYSYNKFALAQQTVLARKQEAETADSASESQRAAADLSQAQTEADSTKEDMHSAQSELASLTGAAAARTIIGRVSGITPSLESITQSIDTASEDSQGSSRTNPIGGLFHHKGKGPKTVETAKAEKSDKSEKSEASEDADEKPTKVAKADTKSETKKDKKGKKDKAKGESKKDGDLSPAPEAAASKPDSDGGDPSSATKGSGDISFQLKGVSVTPRKSILAVTIHNSGSNNFSFSPDVISISDGSHKLSEAAVRADFDQTLVQPNGEVKGTITIFGRPWNERLAVNLPDGSKNIPMRR